MKAIYNAANPIDAQLVSDLLADAGIEAHVQGSFLVGGIGELPAGEMMRVWVPDKAADEAIRIIAEGNRAGGSDSLEMEGMPALRASTTMKNRCARNTPGFRVGSSGAGAARYSRNSCRARVCSTPRYFETSWKRRRGSTCNGHCRRSGPGGDASSRLTSHLRASATGCGH